MKVLLFLALLGFTAALQGPVQYEYEYSARVGAGVLSNRPQYAGTGIKARVKITVEDEQQATYEVSDVRVGQGNQMLDQNGRQEMPISYEAIEDKSIELPWKAYFRRGDGETIMEVPRTDLQWVTNVRRGIVSFFRIAPLTQPSSSFKKSSDGKALPQSFSRVEDTHAGRCRVSYVITPSHGESPIYAQDIQDKNTRKSSSGREVKLEGALYNMEATLDYDSCSERVVLMSTGTANLTNVTSGNYQDVATRAYVSHYLIKGEPGKFRVEQGSSISEFVFNPLGVSSDKMTILSNQTMKLVSTSAAPRHARPSLTANLKPITTWQQQFQSPNQRPEGYNPKFVTHRPQGEEYTPIFYERLASGFGWSGQDQVQFRALAKELFVQVQRTLSQENAEIKGSSVPQAQWGYAGSFDGLTLQKVAQAQRIIRTLTKSEIQKLDVDIRKEASSTYDLFIDSLAIAGSGSSLDVLLSKIQSNQLSANRTASIFFFLANNIQSPEPLGKLMDFVLQLNEEQQVLVSSVAKVNLATALRRLCVSSEIKTQSHMMYAYGNKMCDKNRLIGKFIQSVEQKIKSSSSPLWVKILNVFAAGNLGTRESLRILKEVAYGKVESNNFLRYAAIREMERQKYDIKQQDEIFNILLPLAENYEEDYHVRIISYNTMLTWRPNITFIDRMASQSRTEPSVQMKSCYSRIIESIAQISDPSYRKLAEAADNLRYVYKYYLPSAERPMCHVFSVNSFSEKSGVYGMDSWLSSYKNVFPTEVYTFLGGKYGNVEIPLFESVTFENKEVPYDIKQTIEEFTKPRSQMGQQQGWGSQSAQEQPDLFSYLKIFRSSEVFLPLINQRYRQKTSGHGQSGDQDVTIQKYFNPLEVNVLLPTPSGLFAKIQISSPTLVYSKMRVESYTKPSEQSQLPSLQRLSIKAEGLAKVVTKVNSYAMVFAPWTNKTVMAGIDNEKSISMPLRIEADSQLNDPVQITWAKITPLFKDQDRTPVLKLRNLPFTAIGKTFADPAAEKTIVELKPVHWVYSDAQKSRFNYQLSKINTGISGEVVYEGEAVPPFTQANFVNTFFKHPSRLLELIPSPTIRPYELTISRLPGSTVTSVGIASRTISVDGQSSSLRINPENNVQEPMELRITDSPSERMNKLKHLSSGRNIEYSFRVNFTTPSETKKYELSVAIGKEDKRSSGSSQQVEQHLRKYQVSLLEKNQESQRTKSRCFVGAASLPVMRYDSKVSDLVQHFQSLKAPLALTIYEGQTCQKGQQPILKSKAMISSSEDRIVGIKNSSRSDAFLFNNTREFYNIAVYDRVSMQADWQTPSIGLKNATYRASDLLEGYLFPHVLKNYMAPNAQNSLKFFAKRKMSDNELEVRIETPYATIGAQRLRVWPIAEMYLGYIPAPAHGSSSRSVLQSRRQSSSPHRSRQLEHQFEASNKCFVNRLSVKTFDGQAFNKVQQRCMTVIAETQNKKIQILSKKISNHEEELKIKDQEKDLEITVKGQKIKVDGQELPMSKKYEEIKKRGSKAAEIIRQGSDIILRIPKTLEVEIRHGKKMMMVKIDHSMKERLQGRFQGLCGNLNGQASDDMVDREGCWYPSAEGKAFAASWVLEPRQCEVHSMTPLFREMRHYQLTNCSKKPVRL